MTGHGGDEPTPPDSTGATDGDGPADTAGTGPADVLATDADPAVGPVPTTDYAVLARACADADADAAGFVHVGDHVDPDLRYLARGSATDCPAAFVYVAAADAAVLCPGARSDAPGRPPPGLRVRRDLTDRDPGERAVVVLDEATATAQDGEATLLCPRQIPHDAAVVLERAGYALASTTAVADARSAKTDAERDRLRRVQAAATAGVARAAAVLAAADASADGLDWRSAPLTAERLRRVVAAELARRGVEGAGATHVEAGPGAEASGDDASTTAGDDGAPPGAHDVPGDPIRPGETVRVAVAPRGPRGYRGACTRTYVVGGDGGWERRAHVAVEAARRAGLDAVEPDVPVRRVATEVAAELGAYGFEVDVDEAEFVTGVGLARREAPTVRRNDAFAVGQVLALSPALSDPTEGAVRVTDLVAVTADGPRVVGELSTRLSPAVSDA